MFHQILFLVQNITWVWLADSQKHHTRFLFLSLLNAAAGCFLALGRDRNVKSSGKFCLQHQILSVKMNDLWVWTYSSKTYCEIRYGFKNLSRHSFEFYEFELSFFETRLLFNDFSLLTKNRITLWWRTLYFYPSASASISQSNYSNK